MAPVGLGLASLSRGSTVSGSSNGSDDSATAKELEERFSTMSVSDESRHLTPGHHPLTSTTSSQDGDHLQMPGLIRSSSSMSTAEALASMYGDCDETPLPGHDEAVPGGAPGLARPSSWSSTGEFPGFARNAWPKRREGSSFSSAPTPSAEMWKQQYGHPRQTFEDVAYPRRQPGPVEVPQHLIGRRLIGRALWFANKMGFGFIQHEGKDYFVHYTDIEMKGWRSLSPDDEVEFELEKQGGRIKAIKVTAPGGKPRERPKNEARSIKVCAQDLKGLCRRGASCRFTHIADLRRQSYAPPMHHHYQREMAYMPPHGAPMY